MRTFLAFVIVMCFIGGVYLLQGPDFYWPERGNPSQALFLSGVSSRLLGAALLIIAALGVMAARQAAHSAGKAASPSWQVRFFALTMLALALISIAFYLGEPGPNPESRAHSER
jgi:hypothetical protein